MKLLFTILVASFLLFGCVTPKEITPVELSKYESDSSFHNLWYMGSDSRFHYFTYNDKVSTEYKVSKEKLKWAEEVPIGTLGEYILVLPGTLLKHN